MYHLNKRCVFCLQLLELRDSSVAETFSWPQHHQLWSTLQEYLHPQDQLWTQLYCRGKTSKLYEIIYDVSNMMNDLIFLRHLDQLQSRVPGVECRDQESLVPVLHQLRLLLAWLPLVLSEFPVVRGVTFDQGPFNRTFGRPLRQAAPVGNFFNTLACSSKHHHWHNCGPCGVSVIISWSGCFAEGLVLSPIEWSLPLIDLALIEVSDTILHLLSSSYCDT